MADNNLNSSQRKEVLEFVLSTFKERARKKLQESKRGIHTGKLLESITGSVEYDDGEYQIFVEMEDYGHFIDEGVNGVGFKKTKTGKLDKRFKSNKSVVTGSRFSFKDKKPPIKAISPWAKAKGLNPYAVQNSIWRKGIKGIHFFEETIDSELSKVGDYVAEIETQNILNGFDDDKKL